MVMAVATAAGCAAGPSQNAPTPPGPSPGPPPPTGTGPDAAPAPPPTAPAVGFITSPVNGQVVTTPTTQAQILMTGTYTGTSSNLSVQVLSDPNDLTSWTTVGAAAVVSQSFSATIGPFNNVQWPQGGVLRLRVVDGDGTPLAYEQNNDQNNSGSVVIVGSPGADPTDWQFLMQKPPGTASETQLYYQQINAPARLADFESVNNLTSASAVEAKYFNRNDLGVGRDARCAGTNTGGIACTVRNFGSFGGSESTAVDQLEHGTASSTFAMLYTPPATNPNAVQFLVYDSGGRLATSVRLDSDGDNTSVPQACLNCHGAQATYDAGTHSSTGAALLQFDPLAMDFPTNDSRLTFAAQQTQFFQLDQLVAEAAATPATTELVTGEWVQEGQFNATFIPGAWNTNTHDANLYTQVIAPFCRGCHASVASGGLAFESPSDVTGKAAAIAAEICGAGPNGMPVAQRSASRFFSSSDELDASGNNNSNRLATSARALLLEYLDQPGSCAQGQPQ